MTTTTCQPYLLAAALLLDKARDTRAAIADFETAANSGTDRDERDAAVDRLAHDLYPAHYPAPAPAPAAAGLNPKGDLMPTTGHGPTSADQPTPAEPWQMLASARRTAEPIGPAVTDRMATLLRAIARPWQADPHWYIDKYEVCAAAVDLARALAGQEPDPAEPWQVLISAARRTAEPIGPAVTDRMATLLRAIARPWQADPHWYIDKYEVCAAAVDLARALAGQEP